MKYLMLLLFCSCVTRQEVDAVVWLNNFNAVVADPCDHAFYRKLNTGKFEVISICRPAAHEMVSITSRDFNNILDKALPKPKENNN
jgi:plasmid replication initiation protein